MDDKAARIAARRQAILNARGDRLARLTSSARGEDLGGVYTQDIQAAATSNLKAFVGEESSLPLPPPPPPLAANYTPSKYSTGANESAAQTFSKIADSAKSSPSVVAARETTHEWTPQQQEELLRALFNADTTFSTQPRLPQPSTTSTSSHQQHNPENMDNVLSQLFSSLGGSAEKYLGQAETAPPPPPQRTLGQRLIPLIHLLSMVVLVVWFAMFKEPEQVRLNIASVGVKGVEVEDQFGWGRWARLTSVKPAGDVWSVPTMSSFFWAFTTIELVLHSLRLVSKPTPYRPPFLLELALPHLPPPAPKIIVTSLQYLQMGSMIMNDLAVLVFGLGMVVLVSSWKAG